jgi:hypothetical protein
MHNFVAKEGLELGSKLVYYLMVLVYLLLCVSEPIFVLVYPFCDKNAPRTPIILVCISLHVCDICWRDSPCVIWPRFDWSTT